MMAMPKNCSDTYSRQQSRDIPFGSQEADPAPWAFFCRPIWLRTVSFGGGHVGIAVRWLGSREYRVVLRTISIRTAMTGEWRLLVGILEKCGLEASDVDPFGTTFHTAARADALLGCAGAERYGDTVIVGPVAVLPEFRGQGIALHLVRATLMRARAGGCRQAVYLWNSCASYFSRHGFLLAPRSHLPEEVRASKAFQRHEGLALYCMRCDLA